MDLYAFDQLMALLPDCDKFPTQSEVPFGLRFVDAKLDNFIPPRLQESPDGGQVSSSRVLIISAAGAVGKSTLATAIAHEKGAILWDLAQAEEVGSGSLDAVIFNTIEQGRTEEYLEYLGHGLQFLIIDALDEGRIKVKEGSFRRLLENVAGRAKLANGICFVLLGRTRIAEEAWLVLEEAGINTSILTIDPFDREQANQYIESRLEEHQHTEPYRDCRDLIFDQLAQSVTEMHKTEAAKEIAIKEFVHYPPVLDVVATLLNKETNPIVLKNSLEQGSSAAQGQSVDLVKDVIIRILKREQHEKVIPAAKQRLGKLAQNNDWSNWEALYSIEEQCNRLLNSVLHKDVSIVQSSTDVLPDQLRSEYEDVVRGFFDDHPFWQNPGKLANPVFQSYLYARGLVGDFGNELAEQIAQQLYGQEMLPSRLLAEFYLSSSERLDGRPIVKPEHLGILYDSLLSAESNRNHIRLNIDGPDPLDDGEIQDEGVIEGDFEILTHTQEEGLTAERLIPFWLIVEDSSEICFSRYLRSVFVTVPCTVVLGHHTPEVTIGTNVELRANVIRIEADSLLVGASTVLRPDEKEDDYVILEARSCESHSMEGQPTIYGKTKLLVNWPNAEQYPWSYFKAVRLDQSSDDNALLVAYKRFSRIAREFRSNGRNGLARSKVKIENQRIMKGALERELLDQLLGDKILELRDNGQRYYWVPEYADPLLGVTWQSLKTGEVSGPLRSYLTSFIQKNASLFK